MSTDIEIQLKKDKLKSLELSFELIVGILNQVIGLEHELSTIIRMQQKTLNDKNNDTPQGALIELYDSLNEIKTRSNLANSIVTFILNDQEKKEFAKARVLPSTSSIVDVITLQYLYEEFETESQLNTLDYIKLGELIQRLNFIFENLNKFVLIPKIDVIRNKFDHSIGTLKRRLMKSFRDIGQIMEGVSSDGPGITQHYSDTIITSLHGAYLVFEAMGSDTIEDLLDEVVQSQLLSYDKLGREGGSLYHLDKESLDRRWSGLRRLLYAADQRMKDIFPPSWMFSHRLYLEFCDRTVRHLKSLMEEDLSRYKAVCTACVLARAAERGDNYHSNGPSDKITITNTNDALSTPTGLTETQEYVSRIVVTLKSVLSLEEEMNAKYDEDICTLDSTNEAKEEILARLTQGTIISSLFDDYMGPYVQLERKNLDDIIRDLMSQDNLSNTVITTAINNQKELKRNDIKSGSNSSSNQNNKILADTIATASRQTYDSGGRLFETIRQSMKRCLTLTNGKPLYLLSLEYCGCIEIYLNELKNRCPIINYPPSAKTLNVVGGIKVPPYRMPLEDEISICRVINTAEYCCEVVPKLESQIKSKIKIIYEKDINFTQQTELFTDVIASSITMLVKGVLSLTDGVIKVMKKVSWGSLSVVGDESSYIAILKTTLGDCIPRIRNALSSTWFKNFCTKYATEFLDQYLNVIMTQKKICPIGAEQLLLDTNAIKTIILSLHQLGISSKDLEKRSEYPIPTTYTTFIGNRFQHIAIVLKLICTPEEQFEEMFAILWPEGTMNDMQTIYELKHNPSLMATTVSDLSSATHRGTKNAFDATTKVFGDATKVFGGSMSKTLATMKIATTLKKKRQSTSATGFGNNNGNNNDLDHST